MKKPEELAAEKCAERLYEMPQQFIKSLEYCLKKQMKSCYLAGYKAAQEHAHAALEEAEVKIDSLETNTHGWISVKDRLPELGQDVLVIKDGLYGLACRRKVERKPLPPPQFNNIEIWEWDYGFEAREGRVTHWQELPEPPKEEE